MWNPSAPGRRRRLAQALAALLAGAAGAASSASLARDRPPARTADSHAVPYGRPLLHVTNCNDDGDGSLRAAMNAAGSGAVIDLDALTCSLITLTTGVLTAPNADALTIRATPHFVDGRPLPAVTIDAHDASHLIQHTGTGQLELRGLALRNGLASDGRGGCVYSTGPVLATSVTISGCSAVAPGSGDALGGGIASNDSVELHFSTISGNSAHADNGYAYGGGVFARHGLYAVYSTIANNFTTGVGYGGGIGAGEQVKLYSSLIYGNAATYGAGASLFGSASVGSGGLVIGNSTITSNHATGFGAGVEASGPLDVYNSTIAGNAGDNAQKAAGIVLEGGSALNLVSSIVFGNTQAGAAKDIDGASSIVGHANLIGVSTQTPPADTLSSDPMLAPLADNGGQTLTRALLPGSPAIDKGDSIGQFLCDQRAGTYLPNGAFASRYLRRNGEETDIGAYESGRPDAIFKNGFEATVVLACHPF